MAAVRRPGRSPGEGVRRKLEVASAMAWESLVEAHVDQATRFVSLLAGYEPIEDALPRYFREMDIQATMAAAVRTRVFTAIDEEEPPDGSGDLFEDATLAFPRGTRADHFDDDDDGWDLLRRPQRVVRGVIRRQRRNEEMERIVQLAIARAEEVLIRKHIENAIGFVALLADEPFERAIEAYLSAVDLTGGRAQAVFQRTMAKLADVHLGPGRSAAIG
ncbi:MAG TPA: hypothetical protein VFZ24_12260 [Longimicrobiales bacterium]